MQIFAQEKNQLISTLRAEKRKNYICPECHGQVRVKGGDVRQTHFFHLKSNKNCRLSQKGLIHLRLQKFIEYLFEEEAEMEKIFPEINRIADIALPKSKKIYEIQYSPMSLEEARQRCIDYESLGYHIIWILHDHTYNKRKIKPVEHFLRTKTCYFSNMDKEGNGCIYDQLEHVEGRKRISLTHPKLVNLRTCNPLPLFKWPEELFQRSLSWPLYHEGDFIDCALKGKFPKGLTKQKNSLKELYLGFLHMLLEKSSK